VELAVNKFVEKFIKVEGNKLVFNSGYGEFENWLAQELAQAQQEAVEETLKKVEKTMSGKGYITYEDLEALQKEQE
jgi:hypothetical protein